MPVKIDGSEGQATMAQPEKSKSSTTEEAVRVSKANGALAKDRPQELIIMVGGPGSGKSTFVTTKMKSYVRVNNDELKTAAKC